MRIQTMVKNRIHALLTQHAIVRPDVTDLYGKAGLAWLLQLPLPEPDGQLLRDDLSLLATLREWIHGGANIDLPYAGDADFGPDAPLGYNFFRLRRKRNRSSKSRRSGSPVHPKRPWALKELRILPGE